MATAPEEIEQVAKTSKVETPEAARESEPNGVVESIKDDIMEEENQVVSQTKIDGKQIFFLIFLALIFSVKVNFRFNPHTPVAQKVADCFSTFLR